MKDIKFAKFVVLINCAVPAILLAWDAYRHRLGADPVNFAIRTTGMMTLVFMMLSLLVTPARKWTGINDLVQFRRTLGLYAFFYVLAHFGIFFFLDRAGSVSSTLSEMVKRTYLLVGSIGLVLMIPLAVTSTNGMIRWMGPKRWKALHRLTYLIAIAGVVHYYMLVKADVTQPVAFAIVLGLLLSQRVVSHYLELRSAARKPVVPTLVKKPKFWKGQLRIARIFNETPDIRTFRLTALDGGDLPFDFLPGQYLNLALNIAGARVNRSYTVASSPTRTSHLELSIKREAHGVASRHLHDDLKEGDILNVSGPAGRFTFTGAEAKRVVLIGGGVGITPLMSIIRALTDRCWAGEIDLFFCAKSRDGIVFQEELQYLAARFSNLHLHLSLTQEMPADWTGSFGRITGSLLRERVATIADELIYVCGPLAMIEQTRQMLKQLGAADDRVLFEEFKSPVAVNGDDAKVSSDKPEPEVLQVSDAPDMSPTINFAESGKSGSLKAGKTILELAEDIGVNIDFECRSGICGRCKTPLLRGNVHMEVRDALSDSDRKSNLILACQAMTTEDAAVSA